MAKILIFLPPKLFIRIFVGLCLIAQVVRPELSPSQVAEKQPQLSLCELESFLRKVYNPNEEYELHAAVLRSKLKQLFETMRDNEMNSYQNLDDDQVADIEDAKRSIATLAKNGQLPSREPDAEATSSMYWMRDNNKRNVASMARGGYLNSFQPSGKRNIGSLVRNGMLPTHTPKRSFSSLARSNALPVSAYKSSNYMKRNIGAMARDWALPNHQYHQTTKQLADYNNQDNDNKRDFSNSKKKRDVYAVGGPTDDLDDFNFNQMNSEIPEPYVQSSYNQDDLANGLFDYDQQKPEDEKRFLAPLIHGGWYQQRSQPVISNSDSTDEVEFKDKRHIGALAKTGWLPSYRSFRGGQFMRAGRGQPRIVEYFHPQDRHLQPIIAGACRRCDNLLSNSNGWPTGGYQMQSGWGQPTPPRLTALHWRNFYGGSSFNRKL